MEIEVTVDQGEAHCPDHVFNQVKTPKYIMNCLHCKRHEKNNIPDFLFTIQSILLLLGNNIKVNTFLGKGMILLSDQIQTISLKVVT